MKEYTQGGLMKRTVDESKDLQSASGLADHSDIVDSKCKSEHL